MMNEDVIDVLEQLILNNMIAFGYGHQSDIIGEFYFYFKNNIECINWNIENNNLVIYTNMNVASLKQTIRDIWKIPDDDIIRFMLEKCI